MLDYDAVMNWPFPDVAQTYTARDTILYALGLGYGIDSAESNELRYVYEKDLMAAPTYPVVLGHGKRLWGPGMPASGMRLVSNDVSATGVIFATYEPAGKVVTGTFPGPQPSAAELERRARLAREG